MTISEMTDDYGDTVFIHYDVSYSPRRGELYVLDMSGTQVFTIKEESGIDALIEKMSHEERMQWVLDEYQSELIAFDLIKYKE